jgi:hypothetical protein
VRDKMQIVINIDEEIYKRILPYKDLPVISNLCNDYPEITYAIANGVPLPKGHGRLVDANEIDNNIYDLTRSMDLNYGQISEVVDTAPTIIEADRSEES